MDTIISLTIIKTIDSHIKNIVKHSEIETRFSNLFFGDKRFFYFFLTTKLGLKFYTKLNFVFTQNSIVLSFVMLTYKCKFYNIIFLIKHFF